MQGEVSWLVARFIVILSATSCTISISSFSLFFFSFEGKQCVNCLYLCLCVGLDCFVAQLLLQFTFWHAQLTSSLQVMVIPDYFPIVILWVTLWNCVKEIDIIGRYEQKHLGSSSFKVSISLIMIAFKVCSFSVTLMALCSCLHSVKFLAFAFSLMRSQ